MTLYFAYGSNMLLARLRHPERSPCAYRLGRGRLPGYRLTFDKRGQDGSGKCTIEPMAAGKLLEPPALGAADGGAEVWGVLYRLEDDDRDRLHGVEGVGRGYDLATVSIERRASVGPDPGGADLVEGVVAAYTYVAHRDHVSPGLRPFGWYRDLVIAGAVENRLPVSYRSSLERVEAVPDPDTDRDRRERLALTAGL